MNQPNQNYAPIKSSERINSLDVIRGIALLGILLMNIHGMGLPFAYSDPSVAGGSTGLNLKVWFMNGLLFEGTMRGLFTMLYGAGMVLLTSRIEKSGAGIKTADIYYRRILWLLLFGIFHVYVMLWHGDILYPYAVFGLMLFPMRNMEAKHLLMGGLMLLFIGIAWDVADYREDAKNMQEAEIAETIKAQGDSLTEEQEAAIKKWEKRTKKKTQEEVDEAIADMHKGYWEVAQKKIKLNQFMQTWILYRYWPWDLMSFMLIGMAFFKWKIFQGEHGMKFYLGMMVIGYGIGVSINYYETSFYMNDNFSAISESMTGQTYQVGRLFTTLGHIGLFMLFIKSGILRFLQNALAAVGKMALTNYLMHTLITDFIFFGFGFSLYGQLERYELYYVVFGIWIFQLIYSPIWFRYFQYGPTEWLWRSLTYMKKQPLRIKE